MFFNGRQQRKVRADTTSIYRALLRVAALTSYSAASPSAATRSAATRSHAQRMCVRPFTRALLRVAAPTSYSAATPSAATRSVCVYGLYPRVAARGCAN